MKARHLSAYLQQLLDKYKYILLVLLVGLILLLWPQEEKCEPAVAATTSWEEPAALERRLEALLSVMDGVGETKVLLTVENDGETLFAYDRTESRSADDNSRSENNQRELVTLSENGGQTPVTRSRCAPVYRGAVVVCQGGDSAGVKLSVTRVIQSLTGLSADRIVISKMK